MAQQKKFTREFWQEWQKDPHGTAQRWGLDWNELDQDWQNRDWKNTSWDDFEKMWRKSRWAGWFDWS